ncbi:hypothetical protein [Nocardioides rubriscoriae]|uniref:hypothetical protein n=1 Tax=Nocardioides rubriscoriae TaxID=642762 RepID=UPI0011DFC61C|nr:hypothetical protein [Nocardioides rubriscoriae]
MSMTALPLLLTAAGEISDKDKYPVAGWTAFAIFGLLALAVVVLGFSLTKRLKNVEKAAQAGLYDPSDPKRRDRPARGLAAARQLREQSAAADAADAADRDR